MNSLLNFVVEAHGGLALWRQFTDLVTDVEVRGQLCQERGWSGMVPRSKLLLSLRDHRTVVILPEERGRIVIRPDHVSETDGRGSYVGALAHPRETLLREGDGMNWDSLRTAYFVSHAVRHSLIAPFLYTLPGFSTEEIEPWRENDELWRVLRITFPIGTGSPARHHLAYYGPDGRLRRTRNGDTMIGGLDLAEYVTSYGLVDGILIPTSKDVFACDTTGRKGTEERIGRFEFKGTFLTN